jgi:hypothetical protein
VASRCQVIEFDALGGAAIEAELDGRADPVTVKAAARLARGDLGRARILVSDRGKKIRGTVESMMASVIEGDLGDSPWMAVLNLAKDSGQQAGERVSAVLEGESEEGIKHKTEVEAVRREARRVHLGADLICRWPPPGRATWPRLRPGRRRSSSTSTGSRCCASRAGT